MNTRGFVLALGMALCGLMAFSAPPALAATITVTANAPDLLNGGDNSCALREAITNINNGALTYADCANTGAAYGTSDTINIPAGTYRNLIAGVDEFLNANGSLDILKSVTITGAGSGSTIINGWAIDRVLYIGSGITVSISGVTITNGSSLATGSGFYNLGTTTITSSIITGNFSSNVAGGIENNAGSLTITNSTVSSNSALLNAGGILNTGGTVTITNSTVSGNTALNNGGGIYNNGGTVAITNNSFINGNTATWHGGGIYNWAGTVTATDSTISGNTATTVGGSYGGGIRNLANATITNTTISGNTAENGGGGISSSGPLTVTNSTISGNSTGIGGIGGGGIYNSANATITNTTISGNTAAALYGGGIFNSNGTLTATNTTISGNTATGGGGIWNNSGTFTSTNTTISGNTATTLRGGGIYNNTGTVTSTNSTITGNTAATTGGGIFNNDIATITNTTISGNTATTNSGGGIFNNSGTLTVTSATIVRNTAPAGTGGGYKLLAGTGAFANSIVADNGVGTDCVGAITNNGGNIDKDSTCTGFTHSAAMVQGTGFAALASNGGATQTHALLAGSAAIDAAPTCAGLTTDQRGTARPQGSACDVGAYETNSMRQVSVTVVGAGSVANSGTYPYFAIACPGTCSDYVFSGDSVTLVATPGAGMTLTWSGACTGNGNCVLSNITADKAVTATFAAPTTTTTTPPDLRGVSVAGSGGGFTVTITNNGGSVYVYSIGGTGFSVTGDNCSGMVIAGHETCQLTVTPSSPITSAVTVTLLFYTNYGAAPVEVRVQLTPATASTPATITVVSPANGAVTGSTVTFEWVPAGGGGYQLYICQNADFTDCVAITVNGSSANRVLFAGTGLIFALGLIAPGGRRRFYVLAFALMMFSGAGLSACGSGGSSTSANVKYTSTGLAKGAWFWKVTATGFESETRTFTVQ
jgi:hypothetical protein